MPYYSEYNKDYDIVTFKILKKNQYNLVVNNLKTIKKSCKISLNKLIDFNYVYCTELKSINL